MEWPSLFYEHRSGTGCPMCAEGRPEETDDGIRFYSGETTDAYLRRPDIQRGLSVVIWRGRHVAEPTELDDAEATSFWRELLVVGRALEEVLQPVKMNYNFLGNALPHLHVHVVPRYADDPRPGWPFPFPEDEPPDLAEDVIRADIAALRASIAAAQSRRIGLGLIVSESHDTP